MLTTLEQGVEGGKWFRLFDKVFSERNLAAGLQQVARNKGAPGVDHVTVTAFEPQFPEAMWELSDRLKSGTYRPQAIRRVHIPKPGTTETRPLAPVHFDEADRARSHRSGGGGERDRTDLLALPQR